MSDAARALFAAPAARRALVEGRTGRVEIVLRRGAYVSFGEDWVALGDVGAPFGPLSVTVRGLHELGLAPGTEVQVSGGRLTCGAAGDGAALSLERVRERRMSPIDAEALGDEADVARAISAAEAELPAVPALLQPGVEAITADSPREAVRELAGLGDGLTPAGDDVLAGYAAWRAAAADRSALLSKLAAGRASPLGLAYLRCAERGELPEAGARLLNAIRRGSVDDARASVARLRDWGASSGVALGWGVVTAALAKNGDSQAPPARESPFFTGGASRAADAYSSTAPSPTR